MCFRLVHALLLIRRGRPVIRVLVFSRGSLAVLSSPLWPIEAFQSLYAGSHCACHALLSSLAPFLCALLRFRRARRHLRTCVRRLIPVCRQGKLITSD